MKIILSRKGVDSSAGGFASPIFPDDQMMSLPIPDTRSGVCYRDMLCDDPNRRVAKLVTDLSRGKLKGSDRAHVDPDLARKSFARAPQWQPLFGQCGAAQSHLHSLGVGPGDIFLFFGWFRRVESVRRKWRFVSGAPDMHVIYGWMQVASITPVNDLSTECWQNYHPHFSGKFSGSNVIYQANQYLSGTKKKRPGAGVFKHCSDSLVLTQQGKSRSQWCLPAWMHPQGRESALSYHTDPKRWRLHGEHALLRSAARGQEFVLDLDHYPEGYDWLHQLISA